jgi:hypothetical protein
MSDGFAHPLPLFARDGSLAMLHRQVCAGCRQPHDWDRPVLDTFALRGKNGQVVAYCRCGRYLKVLSKQNLRAIDIARGIRTLTRRGGYPNE